MKPQIEAGKTKLILRVKKFFQTRELFWRLLTAAFICGNLWLIPACRKRPTDMRSLAPNGALIYLETKDLGATLQTLTENKAWESTAQEKPDFSPLKIRSSDFFRQFFPFFVKSVNEFFDFMEFFGRFLKFFVI